MRFILRGRPIFGEVGGWPLLLYAHCKGRFTGEADQS